MAYLQICPFTRPQISFWSDILYNFRAEVFEDDREILNRLAEIENLLETEAQKISVLYSSTSHAQSETSPQSYISCPVPEPKSNIQGSFTFWSWTDDSTLSHLPPPTIPDSHKTSSSYLLTLPCVKALIGNHPSDFFFSLEARTELPPELSFGRAWDGPQTPLSIQREVADQCVSAFFYMVHLHNPILVRDYFEDIYSQFWETGPDSSVSSSLCMIVIALRCVADSSLAPTDFVTDPQECGTGSMQCRELLACHLGPAHTTRYVRSLWC